MEVGVARRALPGESVCGDVCLVVPGPETLVALVDGLGHGPEAALAAERFCAFARERVRDPLPDILCGAVGALAGTRGAAASLVRVNTFKGRLAFAGVGNVELQAASRYPIRPVCSAGIVGRPLRKVIQFEYQVEPGDVLILYSDGISSRLDVRAYAHLPPQALAEAVLAQHAKDHDDASCVAMRIGAFP